MSDKKIELDEWFQLISDSYSNPSLQYKGQDLPKFPSDEVQSNTTGQCGVPTLQEAFIFYKDCIKKFNELNSPINAANHLLDFGVGWGRITRFFLRELPLSNIHGIDVTPEFVNICQETFRSDNFHTCEPYPPTHFEGQKFNFIVGYSVFSHLSEEACMQWMQEFSRLLAPGGILAITTRGRPFFDFCESQKVKQPAIKGALKKLIGRNKPNNYLEALGMLFNNFDHARAKYDRGEFVHSNVEGVGGGGSLNTTFYGETFIPEAYAKTAYAEFLELVEFMYDASYQSHPIMFFRKK